MTRAQLRKTARQARDAFIGALAPATRRALERMVARRVLAELGRPAMLGCYAGTGNELDARPIAEVAAGSGWSLGWPRVLAEEEPMAFHAASPDALEPGYRDIPEPPSTAPEAQPDVLLVPLLAVDAQGHRLGQGGGHYDRTLAQLRERGPVFAIGLAWDVQLVDRVVPEPWDQPLDAIATPTRFHRVVRSGLAA
jgi:5-formyltetrahydrofolate cyclo-ligase